MHFPSRKNRFLYALSFAEGAVVMGTELCGAKLLAPYFGSSLYVWACVMALTLGGLAAGYFLGGRFSLHKNHHAILMRTVLGAAVYIACLPLGSFLWVYFAAHLSLIPAVLLSSSFVLFPPVLMMGMVSPLLIKSLTSLPEEAGKKAGEIYAISTCGGIFFIFLQAFYTIPHWGLTLSLLFNAALLGSFSLVYFIRIKQFFPLLFLAASLFFSCQSIRSNIHTRYETDGLMGKLEVRDIDRQPGIALQNCRFLMINNIIQSCIGLDSGESKLPYATVLEKNLSLLCPQAKNALVLGLGGGVISNLLDKKKISVTAAELDERMIWVSKQYFGLSPNIKILHDDARHALYSLKESYDLIVLDLFAGEVTPAHVLSLESFRQLHGLLKPHGFLFMNTYGYLNGAVGKGNQILLNTMRKAGFSYRICYTGDKAHEDYRNLLLFAAKETLPELYAGINAREIPLFDTSQCSTDDKPAIEFANAEAVKRWRFAYLRNFILNQPLY